MSTSIQRLLRFATTLTLLAACLADGLARCDEKPPERRWDAGPLTADDFQAPVPDPLPKLGRVRQHALTQTSVRFRTKYNYITFRGKNGGDEVQATLTDIDIYAVFLRDKSWLSPGGRKLLDHEQGHFDITQLHALKARLSMQQQLSEGKAPLGIGGDLAAAVEDLNRQIDESLRPVYERIDVAQQQYDRDTLHGTRAANQRAHRKRHLEVLLELTEDRADATSPRSSSRPQSP